ncbi:MAG: sigma 54-interacting transcriptional regulator [Pseudomonadales bacterium]|nr:sigma 54-interacting transcriptional regulator [Pseudomonadales bacterium]
MGDIGKIVKSLGFIEEFVSVTGSLSIERDIIKLLDKVINSACRFTNCDGGRIYMLDVTHQYLELKVSLWLGENSNDSWYQPRHLFGVEHTLNSNSLNGNSATDPLVYTMRTGAPLVVDDFRSFTNVNRDEIFEHDRLNKVDTHSFILVPLVNHERQTIGVLELVNPRDTKYHRVVSFAPLESVIKAFASQAAICINNALLIDSNQKLIDILDSANKSLSEDNRRLREQKVRQQDYQIIGESESIQSVFSLMDKVVDSQVTVLLRGETGTGKEVFAHAIHKASPRKTQPFITQNCAALPEQLLESELFGYKKGAFTGATSEKKGLFDVANGGTLFLDEIGDMPISLQSKLLRVLQESEIRPLGGMVSHKVDVRIIAATHCDLEDKIKKGEFREDLFFRLSVFPIELPPLKVRGGDVIILAEHFIHKSKKMYRRKVAGLSPAVIELLLNYEYPGNVRELQNMIERAVLLCEDGGSILPEHLPPSVKRAAVLNLLPSEEATAVLHQDSLLDNKPLKQAVNDYECRVITQHLKSNNWNQTQTAKALKIPRRTLIDKMTRFNIKTPEKRRRFDLG